jgi:serine/threonine protein kinase
VKSLGWYEDVKAVYIAMEYCALGDLQRYISNRSSLPPVEAQELTHQVLEGLHEMHENGFTHRDLKPAVSISFPYSARYE